MVSPGTDTLHLAARGCRREGPEQLVKVSGRRDDVDEIERDDCRRHRADRTFHAHRHRGSRGVPKGDAGDAGQDVGIHGAAEGKLDAARGTVAQTLHGVDGDQGSVADDRDLMGKTTSGRGLACVLSAGSLLTLPRDAPPAGVVAKNREDWRTSAEGRLGDHHRCSARALAGLCARCPVRGRTAERATSWSRGNG